ncbi:TIGR02301 family protein [Oryzifoliimicrobium ureilyticus]|uniref:TIGR02301 family protein n=1 Tax=Oryzifoliimicrobium ureilyticus TaxID=3113724 RepID=UPI0030760B7A
MIPNHRLFLIFCIAAVLSSVAQAEDKKNQVEPQLPQQPQAAPYDEKLLRLSEVMGSVHYLRTLCKANDKQDWRNIVQQILENETKGEELRKQRLTAAFNRGYRAFASVYTDCTPAAVMAEERYRNEGATLAGEITSRFGN